ncbi:MAG: hypothetical protein KDE08_00160 [Rhodobacteraceae bacterium]|nr:hypothetical protein [Paracoccaceae bacterium]
MCRPKRNIKAAPPKVDHNTLRNGYIALNAGETANVAGGPPVTVSTLSGGGANYAGSSAGDGHAEMDALNQMLAVHNDLDTIIALAGKTVDCRSKPICYRCAIVLGLLGFQPANNQTLKTRQGMGQTQWYLPEPLRTKITEKYGDLAATLHQFPNIGKL